MFQAPNGRSIRFSVSSPVASLSAWTSTADWTWLSTRIRPALASAHRRAALVGLAPFAENGQNSRIVGYSRSVLYSIANPA